MRPTRLLVLAWGNDCRGDDALGPAFLAYAEALAAPPGVTTTFVVDFQLQPEHAIDLHGHDLVLFVDASLDARSPYAFGAVEAVWPVYRRFGVPYAAMLLVNLLPPMAAGGLLSIGRVTSTLFPVFLWLGAAVPARHRGAWLVGFALLQGFAAVMFFTWRPCIRDIGRHQTRARPRYTSGTVLPMRRAVPAVFLASMLGLVLVAASDQRPAAPAAPAPTSPAPRPTTSQSEAPARPADPAPVSSRAATTSKAPAPAEQTAL